MEEYRERLHHFCAVLASNDIICIGMLTQIVEMTVLVRWTKAEQVQWNPASAINTLGLKMRPWNPRERESCFYVSFIYNRNNRQL